MRLIYIFYTHGGFFCPKILASETIQPLSIDENRKQLDKENRPSFGQIGQ